MEKLTKLLAEALTKKGMTFTEGQLNYIVHTNHWILPSKKTFYQCFWQDAYLDCMVENFIKYNNMNRYEHDFHSL
tara:strand:- start:242 stop:466 length:225 start_codon:yes stop_codon:yes gene_type:complete